MKKQNNILVTGASGFIGSNLVRALIDRGYSNVDGIDDLSSGNIDNLYNLGLGNWLESGHLLVIDIANMDKFIHKQYDFIFHLAGQSRIQPSIQDPVDTLNRNILGTMFILEYARKNKSHVIYAGSSSYYGGIRRSPYSWSKHTAGELGFVYNELYNVPFTEFRFFNVYGRNQISEGRYATVIGIFENQYKDKKALTVTGDGEQRRDYTYIDDIVEGLITGIENNNISNGKIYDLGSGKNYSVNEIVDMFGRDKKILPQRKGEYPQTLCNYQKAKEDLNWTPKKSLKEYISAFLADNK